jgi:hypothetical protein
MRISRAERGPGSFYGELRIDGRGFGDAAEALAVNASAKKAGVEMTAVQPIAAVTTASARLRTDRWLGAWHAQMAAK